MTQHFDLFSGRTFSVLAALWIGSVSGLFSQAVKTPAFTPAGGQSTGSFGVTVNCTTPGAVIHYTVSGAVPTVFDPSVVSGGTVVIDRTMTIKAKAWKGLRASAVASADFNLTGDLAGGGKNLLMLSTDGKLFGWGNQDFGRLSNGSSAATAILSPAVAKYSAIDPIENGMKIAAGTNHTLMIDSVGDVWAFGKNGFGEAGNPGAGEKLYATRVLASTLPSDFLTGCIAVSAGFEFSAALEESGQVKTWGKQVSGRLGSGVITGTRYYADRVKTGASTTLEGIRRIALGKDFALACEPHATESPGGTGQVWVWGENVSGQLGLGNAIDQSYAVRSKLNSSTNLTDAWDVAAGDVHAVVVRWKDGDPNLQGSVWTMGSRANGRLGDNGAITGVANHPVQVVKSDGSPLLGIEQVAAGPSHTLALDNSGEVWAWGLNSTGALGDGTTTAWKYAVKVRNPDNSGNLTGIVRVIAGGIGAQPAFSTAIAEDGTIYVWGSNSGGVVANGTISSVPVKLPVKVNQIKTIPGFPSIALTGVVTAMKQPGAVTLTAAVDDPPQGAANVQVEFYLQGALHVTKTGTPSTSSISGLNEGSYHAYAIARDADGNETVSLPFTFEIELEKDTDQDGLDDAWEMQYFGNLNQTATGNPDSDSHNNLQEFSAGTDPNNPDTDGDGFLDGYDDSDADGLSDTWEWLLIANSPDPDSMTLADITANGDYDSDGVSNRTEYQLGLSGYQADSDGDGYSDRLSVDQELFLRLDESTGTSARDDSGANHDGTLAGSPVWQSTTGVDNGGLKFAGGSDAVSIPAETLDGLSDVTMSLWFKTTATSAVQTLLSGAGAAQSPEIAIDIENGNAIRFTSGGGNSVVWGAGRNLADGLWHHIVLVRDSVYGEVSLRLDGEPFGSVQFVTLETLAVDSLVLGQRHQTGSTYDAAKAFVGTLDEIRVWSVAMDPLYLTDLFQPNDLDLDGLPDDWEHLLFENLATLAASGDDYDLDGLTNREEFDGGTSPKDYYNGIIPVITLVSGSGQSVFNGQRTEDPLVFQVTSDGNPLNKLVNAPVDLKHLKIMNEFIGGILSIDGDTLGPELTLRTDSEGKVSVHFKAD